MQDFIYLDYAAATPVDEQVLSAMQPYFTTQFYNPSALYEPAVGVAKQLHEARASVAHWLGARQSEIIFTAGGTESDNLAIHGVMRCFPESNMVASAIEHDAVLEPAKQYDHRLAAVDGQGLVNLKDLAAKIDGDTVMVSVMYANNEVGTIQPLKQVAELVAAERVRRGPNGKPIYLHSDACQAANYLDIHAARLGIDLLTLNGGKLYGPKQSGALYVRAGITLAPLVFGGGQEQGIRSGTENVAACIGFAWALDMAQGMRKDEARRLRQLQDLFMTLVAEKIPAAIINGSRKKRLPNNVHLTIPGMDNERLLLQLERRTILASAGSACSASNDTSSHVLLAMGLTDDDARSSVRFSLGRATSQDDIRRTVAVLAELASA